MNLASAPLHRAFWHYTLPSLAALLVSGTYQVVDGIFVGHFIGGDGLAGINLAWPWVGIMLAAGMMIGIGSGAQASLAQGGGKRGRAALFVAQGLWLLPLLGLPLALILTRLSPSFLAWQGAEGAAAEHAQAYLDLMAPATPLVMASVTLPFLVRNLGAPRLATLALLLGAVGNILLDAVFIAWLQWGLTGAALATLLSESLVVVLCLGFVLSRRSRAPLDHRAWRWRPRAGAVLLGTGFSSMLMYLYLSLAVVLHNLLLLKHGQAVQVAAYGIAGYLMAFYYLAAEGVAGGMQPLVSYYQGAGQPVRVRQTLRLACLVGVGGGILLVLAMMAAPAWFASAFMGEDPALLAATTRAIRLHLWALFLDGFLVLAACWFQSLGLGRKATLITLGNMLIQLPFLALLPLWLGLDGVWLALPLSNVCLSLFVGWLLWRQWRRLAVVPAAPLGERS
ncbi:MATE family efflux transporter [Zobellella sp. DQSA1]|uniref:MATE family efflux transporter n=1 Tax=Zobellella sp. DQSA1 TaxID=3342386 RepID=UPI0035C16D09